MPHLARRYSSRPSGRTTESWSPSAKRASRSFGVIRSKPLKSRMLPQRLATWLSATRKRILGNRLGQARDRPRLKMPWRKSREHHDVGRRLADLLGERVLDALGDRAVVERVDLEQLVAAGDDRVLVRGRPGAVDDRHAFDAGRGQVLEHEFGQRVVAEHGRERHVGAGGAQVLGDDGGAADEIEPLVDSARSWSASWSCRRSARNGCSCRRWCRRPRAPGCLRAGRWPCAGRAMARPSESSSASSFSMAIAGGSVSMMCEDE